MFLQIKDGCSKPPTVSSISCKISSQKKIPSLLLYKVMRFDFQSSLKECLKWPCPTWSSNSFLPEAHLLSIHYQCIDSGKNMLYSTRLERTTRLIICTTLLTRLFTFIINKQGGQPTGHLSNSIFSLNEKFYFQHRATCLKLVPRNTVQHFYYVKCFSLAQHRPFLQE